VAGKAFSGGEKLQARLAELARNLSKSATVKVGFMGGAIYPDGTLVAAVAAFNEFGVPSHNQPPRPFFRGMIADKSPTWGDGVAEALKRCDYDAAEALDAVGEDIAGQLGKAIQDYSGPMLAPSTVATKGFAKQLIDTGDMWRSITHEVEE